MFLFVLFSFSLSFSDTIGLSNIPDTIPVYLTQDFPPNNKVAISKNGGIFIVEHVIKAQKSFLFHFDSKGTFQSFIGKQGEAPEEYSFPVWDIRCNGDTVFAFSGRKLTMYTHNGKFINSALLKDVPNIRDGVLFSKKNIFIYGLSWDYNYDKKLYIMKNCIFEYSRNNFKSIGSFFTPPISSEFFDAGLGHCGFCGDIDNNKIWLVKRPLPQIFVIDIGTKRLEKTLKLKIRGFKRVKLVDTERWIREGIFNDTDKFMSALEGWSNALSFIDNLLYIKDSGLWVLDYRDYSNGKKTHYLVIIDKKGRVLNKMGIPGRLLTIDKNNRLYFALNDTTLLKGTLVK